MKGTVYNRATDRENKQTYQRRLGRRVEETDKHRKKEGQMRG